jgi:adenosine deaminase
MQVVVTPELARTAPKVLLHDHLDGGVRPATIVELAEEYGYDALPTTDVDELAASVRRGANRRNLELYLQTFAHTVGVMQRPDALRRVAFEAAEDLSLDGVAYAEIRMAPELCTEAGLKLDEVTEAILDGFAEGERAAASAGRPIVVRMLATAMRTAAMSAEIAELALRFRDRGVVGFDIAGAEAGYPPSRHMDAFDRIRHSHGHLTIHAGEAFGLPSISEALGYCGAERLGHGVRIVDDIKMTPEGAVLGELANYVRDRRVPLEMCPSSNVHTGAAPTFAEHPIGLLMDLKFRVTVNTDNRLMSGVALSDEFANLGTHFGIDLERMQWLTVNAMKSAFIHFDERLSLINDVIKPGYQALMDGEGPDGEGLEGGGSSNGS